MHIWVDADACPRPVKDVLFRASKRTGVPCTLVANQFMGAPPHVQTVVVAQGSDGADRHIADHAAPGDIVITADIPLASDVVDKGCLAINPRGQTYTEDNVKDRLATRDLMDELRSAGMETGGPAAFSKKDIQAFANALDRLLARR